MAGKHPSHKTRFSWDASSYDEMCVLCNRTDIAGGGWGDLAKPCPVTGWSERECGCIVSHDGNLLHKCVEHRGS